MSFQKLGLSETDLRWLVRKGYVEHAQEITVNGDSERQFRSAGVKLSKRSCLVLTDDGAAYAQSLMSGETRIPTSSGTETVPQGDNGDDQPTSPATPIKPRWDGERHELWVGDQLVKQFKGQAKNQETILAVFEEEGWPPRIDDPLSLAEEIDPKRRLHDTIKCLNRKQRYQLIHFRGEGIIWECASEPACRTGEDRETR